MAPELGLVEGFFGRPWTWAQRREVMQRLAPHGFGFHLYAPKADAFLRRRWTEPHPDDEAQAMADFAAACRAGGVRFGVEVAIGLERAQPHAEAHAARQVQIAHFAAEHTGAGRMLVCPVYYSNDPVLDRVFGARPEGFLEDFGRRLDPSIGVFWTGEEVCAREFSRGHLQRIGEQLRRKPTLWDNYPVNDGPRMSRRLHLRGVTGRPGAIAPDIAAHAVNPMLQPTLSCIPALTLAASYRLGEAYSYGAAFREAAEQVAGTETAALLAADMPGLQDQGLDLSAERLARMRARYAEVDHPAAREVVSWIDGDDFVSAEDVQTQ